MRESMTRQLVTIRAGGENEDRVKEDCWQPTNNRTRKPPSLERETTTKKMTLFDSLNKQGDV